MDAVRPRSEVNTLTLNMALAGLFILAPATAFLSYRTFFPADAITAIILVAAAVAMLVYYQRFSKRHPRFLTEVIIFCWLGVGCFFSALFLAINYLGHGPVREVNYLLQDGESINIETIDFPLTIRADDAELNYYWHMLTFAQSDLADPSGNVNRAVYRVADGAFGVKVLLGKRLE